MVVSITYNRVSGGEYNGERARASERPSVSDYFTLTYQPCLSHTSRNACMASELVILLRTTFAYQLTTRLAETHFLQFLLAVFEPKHERDERNRHELENRDGPLYRTVRSGSSCADAAVVAGRW